MTSIYYDTKSQKAGILIPMSEQDLKDRKGVVRYFYHTPDAPLNDWQTLDKNFIYIAEMPTNERFFVSSVLQMLRDNPLDKNLHKFWRERGIES